MTELPALDRLLVSTPQGDSGVLAHDASRYLFAYDARARTEAEVSLLMPRRTRAYEAPALMPVFEMNLPEGYVLERLRQRFAKASRLDPMLLLALTGRASAIGRVRVDLPPDGPAEFAAPAGGRGESLASILAWDGAQDLFEELAQRYLLRSGVSGMQPKLLVPEEDAQVATDRKVALPTRELIVKSGGVDFPGLAINEFVCMSIARTAGLRVPDFHLSGNRRLFVMRRFDRDADGRPLGFEEMGVLMGKGAAQKYDGRYEHIARAIEMFCSPRHQRAALARLFYQVALSCILGNGDAHLKNFGLLYPDPTVDDVDLAPAYDIVCTTAYLPDDQLALSLGGSRSLYAARLHLLDFGRRCGVEDPPAQLAFLLEVADQGLADHAALLAEAPEVAAGLRAAVDAFGSGRAGAVG